MFYYYSNNYCSPHPLLCRKSAINITGVWDTTFYSGQTPVKVKMTLQQNGIEVTGNYDFKGGEIRGLYYNEKAALINSVDKTFNKIIFFCAIVLKASRIHSKIYVSFTFMNTTIKCAKGDFSCRYFCTMNRFLT